MVIENEQLNTLLIWIHKEGEKASKLLASKLKNNKSLATISSNNTESGAVSSDPKTISDTFRTYYSRLYKSESKMGDTDFADLWKS